MTRQGTFQLCVLVGMLLSLSSWTTEINAFSSLSMTATSTITPVGTGKTTVIAGASGYIGKSVVRESVRQGYKTIALVRDKKRYLRKRAKLCMDNFLKELTLLNVM